MKNLKELLISIVFALALASCSVSTEELAVKVQKNMEEKFLGQGITIKSLGLTKKGGNVYSGILETVEPNGAFTYTIEVIYDGENIQWTIQD